MADENSTKPYVFIIESLEFKDEEKGYFEGEVISKILNFSNIEHKYYYIRTKKELEHLLGEFVRLNYRYLHISCHGNSKLISTTLDRITFKELSSIIADKLCKKRLFLSSCLSTNDNLAKSIFSESKCLSIIGPDEEINMDDSAIFWASFYQIMFKDNSTGMKAEELKTTIIKLKKLYGVPLKYYKKNSQSKIGWEEVDI
ncbi:hypothetical protein LV89_01909 [Arcicella aurantiaca]|uniref:CHAT domain-containing protein n=1 Tax=Arcicella aurantiaca TaxID=591202 RepID=A0A316ECI9_9BACT|nr:hypothetical protein [Arcicella aurantiaca]PWK27095.1 hypothetical protein LV89_01909 [Arcicella aurantiaca]